MAETTTDVINIILRVNGQSGYVNALNQVTNSTNSFGSSIGNVTSLLGKLVSAGAIIAFTRQCITAASDLQEVANVINVTFGQASDVVNKWAKTQAANFGLSETSAKRYIGTYGTMATQFGLTRDQAAKMGIELTKLTGDVASFYNIDEKLASIKLKSVFTGETETLKELGVVMTQAQLDAYAMEKGLGKTTKQMSEQEKLLLRYQFTMDKLAHTQGDFQRTSDGWANSARGLKLNLENLKIEIGNELLPVAGMALSAVNKGLQTLAPYLIGIAQTVHYYAEAWKNASAVTKGFVKIALGAVAIAITVPKVITIVSKAVKLLTMDIVTLGGAISATLGILGLVFACLAFAQLSKQVKEMKESAENISNIGESADTSTEAVDSLSDAMDGLGDSAQGLNTFLASFDEVNKVGGSNSLMSSLVSADDLSNIMAAASGIENLNDIMSEISSSVSSLNLGDISKDTFMDPAWWEKKWNGLKGFFKTFFNGEWKENWEIGFEAIGQWMEENLPEWWTQFWEGVGEAIYDFKTKYVNPVLEALQSLIDKVKEILQAFDDSKWSNFWERVGAKKYDEHYEDITSRGSGHQRYSSGETAAIPAYGGAMLGKAANQTINNNSSPTTVQVSPTIMIDGKKITSAVIDGINAITVSAGKSPLVE